VTGRGQTIDAAMVDGAALLMGPNLPYFKTGAWGDRGEGIIDGGAPYYRVYETADGRQIAFGAMEPPFYQQMLLGLGFDDVDVSQQDDRSRWPDLRKRIAETIRGRTRDEWEQHFAPFEACFSPVLHPLESPDHPHSRSRAAFVDVGDVRQPAPAPRFSDTACPTPQRACRPGEHTVSALSEWGVPGELISEAIQDKLLWKAPPAG
jgi:alpha-methylacyl-CoA racemase